MFHANLKDIAVCCKCTADLEILTYYLLTSIPTPTFTFLNKPQ